MRILTLSGCIVFPMIRHSCDTVQLRRIPTINDIADLLRTYLEVDRRDAESLVLVSHSQGGLIVQRYLARMLDDGRGRELARIKRVVMYGCPNTGSAFLGSIRQLARFWHHPQERQLRPYAAEVSETQRVVLSSVVRRPRLQRHRMPDPDCGLRRSVGRYRTARIRDRRLLRLGAGRRPFLHRATARPHGTVVQGS